ncbi:unnamed protein product [Amoebophrya sp. A25]|nr:unnamed protein product [Amoebophrya sp. A25]|eukprot:GSA25T00010950001.1
MTGRRAVFLPELRGSILRLLKWVFLRLHLLILSLSVGCGYHDGSFIVRGHQDPRDVHKATTTSDENRRLRAVFQSPPLRVILIHVPKTGGLGVEKALRTTGTLAVFGTDHRIQAHRQAIGGHLLSRDLKNGIVLLTKNAGGQDEDDIPNFEQTSGSSRTSDSEGGQNKEKSKVLQEKIARFPLLDAEVLRNSHKWPILSIVRNPYDRMWSVYNFPFTQEPGEAFWRPPRMSFEDFILNFDKDFAHLKVGGTAPLAGMVEFLARPEHVVRSMLEDHDRHAGEPMTVAGSKKNFEMIQSHQSSAVSEDERRKADARWLEARTYEAVDPGLLHRGTLSREHLLPTDYLRFEHLEPDFDHFCKKYGLVNALALQLVNTNPILMTTDKQDSQEKEERQYQHTHHGGLEEGNSTKDSFATAASGRGPSGSGVGRSVEQEYDQSQAVEELRDPVKFIDNLEAALSGWVADSKTIRSDADAQLCSSWEVAEDYFRDIAEQSMSTLLDNSSFPSGLFNSLMKHQSPSAIQPVDVAEHDAGGDINRRSSTHEGEDLFHDRDLEINGSSSPVGSKPLVTAQAWTSKLLGKSGSLSSKTQFIVNRLVRFVTTVGADVGKQLASAEGRARRTVRKVENRYSFRARRTMEMLFADELRIFGYSYEGWLEREARRARMKLEVARNGLREDLVVARDWGAFHATKAFGMHVCPDTMKAALVSDIKKGTNVVVDLHQDLLATTQTAGSRVLNPPMAAVQRYKRRARRKESGYTLKHVDVEALAGYSQWLRNSRVQNLTLYTAETRDWITADLVTHPRLEKYVGAESVVEVHGRESQLWAYDTDRGRYARTSGGPSASE